LRFLALPLLLLLPGYLTLYLPLWGGTSKIKTALGECIFLSSLLSVLIAGWLGLILAQLGLFSLGNLLLALIIYLASCLVFIAVKKINLAFSPLAIRLSWEDAIIIALLCLSLLLYARPGEYILAWLDPGWYVNAGIHVAKTGSLAGESRIFSSLPPPAKPLFYHSFASFKEMFPYFPDVESRGIYLMSFAMADPDRGELSAYHPPLFSIWIAIFYALGGLRFCLYAAPLFGALSVLGFYLAGREMFDRKVGLLAAILLCVNFTQIYFSRVPYSEVFSQLLLFSGIYALATYIREHKPLYAVIAALSFGQALLARLENVILILPLAVSFGCWMALRRGLPENFHFFAIPFGLLIANGVILGLTVSRPYLELNLHGLWFQLRPLLTRSPVLLAISVIFLSALLLLVILLGSFRSPGATNASWLSRIYEDRHLIATLLSLAVLLLAIYAYFIRPSIARGAGRAVAFAELGQFLSPLGLWLGVLGLVELIRHDVTERTAFFLALVLIYSLTTISVLAIVPTLSYVYPIRRQVPFLIPSLILLASYAIMRWNKRGRLLRAVQLVAIGILLASFLALSMPYLNYREMQGTIAFSERLAGRFGDDKLSRLTGAQSNNEARGRDNLSEGDVVLFEAMWAGDSHVGHFAAPLWAIYDKDALLLSTANPDGEALSMAVAEWLDDGKKVYFVSQSNPPSLFLKEYGLLPVAEETWRSSTIAAILAFPPEVWKFEIPFYIYQIARRG